MCINLRPVHPGHFCIENDLEKSLSRLDESALSQASGLCHLCTLVRVEDAVGCNLGPVVLDYGPGLYSEVWTCRVSVITTSNL